LTVEDDEFPTDEEQTSMPTHDCFLLALDFDDRRDLMRRT
jgi:hypothetical protein